MVSVIIPVYNRAATIARAIRSVLGQSYSDFEIVVVDDGSRDGTGQIVQTFQSQTNKIRYFFQTNAGPSAARNRGIAMAKGEYLAFLDSDDLWYSFKLAKQLPLFDADPDLGLVYSWAEVTNPAGKRQFRNSSHAGCCLEQLLSEGNFIATSSAMVRKTVMAQVGGFDESLQGSEDIDLWLRIAGQFKIGCVEDYLMIKCEQTKNSLQNNHAMMFENQKKVIQRYLDTIHDLHKKRVYLAKYYRRCLPDFYDVPGTHSYYYEMIRTFPAILFEFKTYRSVLSFIRNYWLYMFSHNLFSRARES